MLLQTHLAGLVAEVQELLEQAGASLGHLDRMEEVFQSLRESSDKINTRLLDSKVGELGEQQAALAAQLAAHQDKLDQRIEAIQGDLYVQQKNVSNLSHLTLKAREKEAVDKEAREEALHRQLDSLVRLLVGMLMLVEVLVMVQVLELVLVLVLDVV